MYRGLILSLLCLCGCNAPGLEFAGAAPTRVQVEGSTFDVRVSGSKAEAIRINKQYAPRLGRIEFRARAAMEKVSGCEVVRLKGDQALLVGTLSCNGKPVAPTLHDRPSRLDCYLVDAWTSAATNEQVNEFDCSWER